MSHLLAPSLLASDFANLQRDVELVNASDAHWFHLDVMDGVFVPNISFGMPVMEAIARHAKKPLDVHLMIVDPDRYIQAFADLGANVLTVHAEACTPASHVGGHTPGRDEGWRGAQSSFARGIHSRRGQGA